MTVRYSCEQCNGRIIAEAPEIGDTPRSQAAASAALTLHWLSTNHTSFAYTSDHTHVSIAIPNSDRPNVGVSLFATFIK